MQLDADKNEGLDVAYVAHLARLDLTDDETALFQGQLEDIVGYVNKMSELDLEDVEPTSHASLVQNIFREDVEGISLPHEAVVQNAPEEKDGLFVVPKIVE
jgi:aspartyl-tRNA(Asn)/glutamyl-tRNA(Gln) amidotransferase subunit C